MSNINIFLLLFLVAGGYRYYHTREIKRPAGIIAPAEPIQVALDPKTPKIQIDQAKLQPLASYELTVRVLSTSHYWIDPLAPIAPYDWAVGWGPMSDSKILDNLQVSQGDRFFFLAWNNQVGLDQKQILSHSANMHLIPANKSIRSVMGQVRDGSLVHLKGSLVRVSIPGNQDMTSSLVRDDTGPGACEIMLVEQLDYLP